MSPKQRARPAPKPTSRSPAHRARYWSQEKLDMELGFAQSCLDGGAATRRWLAMLTKEAHRRAGSERLRPTPARRWA